MADQTIERLLVSLEARMKSYETSLNRAIAKTDGTFKKIEGRANQFERRLEASARRAGAAFGRVGGAIGGSLTGRAGILGDALPELGRGGYVAAAGIGAAALGLTVFYQQGKAALAVADDLGDAAETLGLSAEALQEIRFAFNGLVDAATVDSAIGKLSKTIGEASLGNKEAASTFKMLGVSIKDGAGNILPTETVLRSIADKIAGMKSQSQQAALASKLLGKEAGTKLLPILRQGSAAFDDAATRARAMGAIIGNETVARAGELQQQLDDLAVVLRAQLTEGFVQAGPQIVAFTRLLADSLPVAVDKASKVLAFLTDHMQTLGTISAGLTGARLGAFIGGFLGPLGTGVGTIIGAASGVGAAYLSMADDAESAAAATVQAIGTMGTAESGHLQTLQSVRDIYDELKTASGDRAKALKDEADAVIDKATKERLAAAESELAKRQAEAAQFAANVPAEGSDPMGSGFGAAIMAATADTGVAEQEAVVAGIRSEIGQLKSEAAGISTAFDPATASVDELVQHLGQINGDQITQTQADMVSANTAVQDLVATVQGAPAEIQALNDQYNVLLADLASVTGWDSAGQSMANFIQGAQDIAQQLREGMITTDQAAERYRHLLDLFNVSVDASQIVGEIGRIRDAMNNMGAAAQTAFATLGSKLGGVLRRFVLGQGGEVVPDNAGIPRPRGTPPAPVRTAGGGITLPAGGGGGGGGKAKKEPKEPKLPEFIANLERETAALRLNSAAQKESEALTRAAAIAKEDHKNKLRESAALTDAETAAIKRNVAAQQAVPDILSMAGENLPQFGLSTRLKELEALKASLTDPAIAEALAAQGLTATDATKAIDLEMQKATDSAWGTAGALSAVGDAILSGAQAAGTLADKLMNIGLELAKLLAQGLFGQGPLGGIFNQLLNVGAGGIMSLAAGTPSAGLATQGVMNGAGFRRSSASGNRLGGGMGTMMNELGQEAVKRGRDIFIPGSPATVMPASATRSAMADGLARGDMNLNLSVTGIGDKELLARVTAASQQAARQGIAAYDRKLMDRVDDQRMRTR